MDKIFIIIPCYNEKEVIRKTVLPLMALPYEVVVVDDGSAENILEEIQDLNIHFLRHPVNLGQGAALQTGMDYAYQCAAEYLVHFDADGQHQISDLEKMLQPLIDDKCDVALGSRFLNLKSKIAVPFYKRSLLRMAKLVNGIFTGIWLTDAHNGFRALNRNAFSKIRLEENNMVHATEIIQQIKYHDLRYQEVPTKIIYTEYSKQKGQSPLNAISIFIDLILKKLL